MQLKDYSHGIFIFKHHSLPCWERSYILEVPKSCFTFSRGISVYVRFLMVRGLNHEHGDYKMYFWCMNNV